ncbi:MAG: hypothetical protein QOG89_3601, partial [Thermomicrobiales bacterium]|nr:hypothetical protein [Thermomicrobiales bacterium]
HVGWTLLTGIAAAIPLACRLARA